MHLTQTELFLVAMLLVFTLPFLAWKLAGKPSFAPLVVVQIVAGILLGPGVFGHLFPVAHQAVFTPRSSAR